MLAAGGSAPIAVELTVRIKIISFEISIYALTPRARGAPARGGLDHNERGLVLLGDLRRRQSGLLQRGILAEQRFLQRPCHREAPRSSSTILAAYAGQPCRLGLYAPV
jgi:hypothetical protein